MVFTAAATGVGVWIFEAGVDHPNVMFLACALFLLSFIGSTVAGLGCQKCFKTFGLDVPDPPPKASHPNDPAKGASRK